MLDSHVNMITSNHLHMINLQDVTIVIHNTSVASLHNEDEHQNDSDFDYTFHLNDLMMLWYFLSLSFNNNK